MEPEELLELTETLCRMESSAARRAAISRSYYFAFHHLKLWLDSEGIPIRTGPGGHQDVIEALHQSKHPLLRSISSKCDQLRSLRIGADYRLSQPRFETIGNATGALETARWIAETLQKFQAAPAEERSNALAAMVASR